MGKKQFLAIVICFVLCFITFKTAYGLTIFVNSPYPDYWFGGDKTNGWRFDYIYGDKVATPLNNMHITEPKRITLIPPYDLCTDWDTCTGTAKIKQVNWYLNNVFHNTEKEYPYDFSHTTVTGTSEEPDTFPENGYYTIKAVVTLADDSTLEMYCQFIWGDVTSQQVDLVLHYFTTDNTVKFNWKKVDGDLSESWDIYLWHMEHEEKVFETNVEAEEGVLTYQLQFMLPKTGHYLVYIRSKRVLADSFIERVNDSTSLELLKGTIGGIDYEDGGVCDIPKWWDDTASLDAMKSKILEVNALCSRFYHSGDANLAAVKSKSTGELENRGWWLFGFVAPPSDATIE